MVKPTVEPCSSFEIQHDLIVEMAAEAIISIDSGHIIRAFNKGAEQIFGYSQNEATGRPLDILLPDDVAWRHASNVRNFGREEPDSKWMGDRGELRGKRKNGDIFPLEASICKQVTASGMIFTVILRDITEKKFVENELRQRHEELESLVLERTRQLEKALEQEKEFCVLQQNLISLASHEFRTPLTIIDGSAQRIARHAETSSPHQLISHAKKIRDAVSRMIDLIDTMLYANHWDSGAIKIKIEPVDIKEMIAEICRDQADISPNHEIHVDIDGLARIIDADRKLIRHIFENLLSNAVKYAPGSPHIEVRGWTNGENVLVSVRDQGVGIPHDEIANMFRRFFRARTAEGIMGTGIGLNVCKEFTELHGGTIEVESLEGKGSTFTVSLPIHQSAERHQPGSPAICQHLKVEP